MKNCRQGPHGKYARIWQLNYIPITAAAPSQIPEALAAVTTPPFLKTGGSLAICSGVVWGFGCSSVSNSFVPYLNKND